MPDPSAHSVPEPAADPLRDAARGVRLHKALAEAGVASRRACEDLVRAGLVSVNGRVVQSLPAWVDLDADVVEVEGRRIEPPRRRVCVLLNKPRRCLSTCDDPGGRRTVVDLVDHPLARRLYPVGRLDFDTSGLLLLTNDGDLAQRLTHPRFGVEKTYRAKVQGCLDDARLRDLLAGAHLAVRRDGRTVGVARAAAVEARIVRRDREKTTIELTLAEGRNRQVRRLLARLGHPVVRLERVRLGPIRLKGLRRGEWRELTSGELQALRRAARAPGRRRADDTPSR